MIKGKKAGERYLTPWLFLVWVIIGVGIAAGIIIFYSAQADVRKEEADILAVRIIDCLVDNGYFVENFNSFDIFENCNLDEKVIENGELYFIDIRVYNSNDEEIEELRQKKGVLSWENLCEMQKEKTYAKFPQCSEEAAYALNKTGSQLKIKIVAASNQL